MALAQAYQDDLQDSKYVSTFKDTDGDHGSRYNQDRKAANKLAFHGKGGNLSSRPIAGQSANQPKPATAAQFQKSRKRK
jgi:hypothetical protein